MGEIPEPDLDSDELRAFARGVDEFNRGCFFECHDTLEDLWAGVRGPSRDFLQGLIQVSVALYHLTGGNRAGAESLFRRALSRFAKYPGVYWGFDLDAHRVEIRRLLDTLAAGDAVPPERADLPKWRFGWLRDAPGVEPQGRARRTC